MGTSATICSNRDVRWNVILTLQKIMSRSMPGSRVFDIADKAIELALSPQRIPENLRYFRRNVWRNAAYSVARSQKSHHLISLDSMTPQAESTNIATQISPCELADPFTPEDHFSGMQLESLITVISEQVAPGQGAGCAKGLIAKDTIKEISCDLQVSPRTVKRLLSKVRIISQEILREKAA